jgi:filamentous hemagglutinin
MRARGATLAALNSGAALTVDAGATSVSGAIQSTGPILFTVASLNAAAITGQSNLGVSSVGSVLITGTTSVLGAASIGSGSTLSLATFTSGPGLTLTSPGLSTWNGPVSTSGALTANVGSLSALSTVNAGSLTVVSPSSVSIGGLTTTATGVSITSAAATLGPVNAGAALGLSASGPVVITGAVNAGSTLNVSGVGLAASSTITSGSGATLASTGAMSLGGLLDTGGVTNLSSSQGMTLAGVASGGALTASGAGISSSAAVSATGAATLNSAAALSISGPLNASGPVALTSIQAMTLGNVSAGPGFTATSAGFSAGSITSAAQATIDAQGGLTLSGGLNAAGPVTLTSADNASLRAITTTSAITLVSGGDLTLLGILTSGSTISAQADDALGTAASARAPGSIALRSGVDGSGNLTFTAAGISVDTPALTLRAGDGPGGVKTATVNALSNAPSFRGFAGAGTSPVSYTHQQDASIVDAQTAAAAQFSGGLGGIAYRLISDAGQVTIADASKFSAVDLTVRSATGFAAVPFSPARLTIEGPLASGSRTIDVGAATLTLSDAQSLGASDLSIFADEINILAPIASSGRLTLGPGTLARPFLIGGSGDSGVGTLDLTASELDQLTDGFASLTFGRPDSTGSLGFAAPRQFRDPLVLRTGPGAVMTLDQPISAIGDGSLRFESVSPIRLGTALSTLGRPVEFVGPVRLAASSSVTTAGGAITFDGAVDSATDGFNTLSLLASGGLTTFTGPVGQTVRPASVKIAGDASAGTIRVTDQISVGALTLNADATYAGNSMAFSSIVSPGNAFSLRVTPTGLSSVVNFTGDVGAPGADPSSITVDAGGTVQIFRAVRSVGPILFSSPVAYETGAAIVAADAPITFASDLTGEGSVTVNAGAGPTSFQSVTTTLPDGPSLTLLSAGLSTFNAPVTLASGLFAAGPVRIAADVSILSALAPTTLNNSVDLVNSDIVTVGDIAFGFSSVHTLNPVGASSVVSSAGSIRVRALTDGAAPLVFAAPVGSISFDEPVGSVAAPASLSLTGSSVAVKSVRTVGPQLYQGPTVLGGNILTSGAPITLSGPITLATDVTIDSTNLATVPGADISIAGTVDSDAASPRGLSVVAGTGLANLAAGVGQTRPLSGLTVAASSYDLPAVTTTGPQAHVGTKRLHGDLRVVGAGSIILGDTTTLASDLSIITPGGASDLIRIAGLLDDASAGAHRLTINSGASQTLIDATVGSLTPPKDIAITAGAALVRRLTQTESFRTTGPLSILDNLTILGGDLAFGAPVVVAADVTLSAANIGFASTLNGDSGPVTHNLTLASPGLTSFGADVGMLRPFESITTDAGGTTRVAGSRVITFGTQNYNDAVVLGADTHLAGTSLAFASTIDSDATPRGLNVDTDTGGIVTFSGNIGSTSPLAFLRVGAAYLANPSAFSGAGNPLENSARIDLSGDVSATGDVVLGGPVRLGSDAIVRSAAGDIFFRSSIDSDATPRTLAILTNRDTTGTQPDVPLIRLNGPVGQQQPLANLWFNYLPASLNNGTLIDGRAEVPAVSTVVIADQLDADGNIPASSDTTHVLPVTTTGDIIFGHNEKLLSIGTVNLTSTAGKIAVGDITSLGDANLTAATGIELRRRAVGSVLDVAGVSVPDLGLDYVTAGKVNFSRAPSVTDDGPEPTFANPTGERGTNSTGFAFRIFTGGIDMSRLVPPKSSVAAALDLRSLGPSDTNVAQAIAGAIPTSDTGSVTTSVTVGAGLRDQLAEIGIFVKDLLPEDVLQMLAGRALYNDVPSSGQRSLTAGGNPFADPTLGEYRVSVNRLPTRSVVDVLSAYQALAYNTSKDDSGKIVREDLRPALRDTLLEAWRAFAHAESGGKRIRLDARRFRIYLESRGSDRTEAEFEALATLEQIKEILARLRAMGLSPVEYQISRNAILSGIAPEQIGTAALGDAAEFDPADSPVSKAPAPDAPEPTAGKGF